MRKIRVDFVTNLAPHYRAALWKRLLRDDALDPCFVFGQKAGSSIRSMDFSDEEWIGASDRLVQVRNVHLRNVLIWQKGVLGRMLKTDAQVVVLLGHIYALSTWLAALMARFRGIKVFFWGHGIYGREGAFKRWFITRFLSLADMILVYGERAERLLVQLGCNPSRVQAVYNSLDHAGHVRLRARLVAPDFYSGTGWFRDGGARILLFVGRLTEQKGLEYLIEAVRELSSRGEVFNLVLVGDGPVRGVLEMKSESIRSQVHFYGSCYDEEMLGRLVANADLCVSPGEVGLTAIHALSFGTPVCTHGAMGFQMPEAEAVIPGKTGIFFSRERMDIAATIVEWFRQHSDRHAVRRACYEVIDSKWNTENQARIIRNAILVSS